MIQNTINALSVGASASTSTAIMRITKNRTIGAVAAALLLALLHTPTDAASLIQTTALTGVTDGDDLKSATGGTVSSQKGGAFNAFSAQARSEASFGVLRVYAEGHAGATGGGGGVSAGSEASFRDDFTVEAPARSGQSGFITIKIAVHGTLATALRTAGSEQFTAQTYSRARLYIVKDSLANPTVLANSTRMTAYNQVTTTFEGQPFLNQVSTHTIPITFGTPFELKIILQAGIFALEKFGADCMADMGNTAEWGGIASVTDGGGTPLSEYSVSSATGTDYTVPIPFEPLTEFRFVNSIPRISFTTLLGRSYAVERKNQLTDPTWVSLSNVTSVTGTGAVLQVEDTEPGASELPSRFYRVRLLP